mmetsp:Transcript_7667/g.11610  ORF Transcript_7667/g.11610 Transcript_7667/m.11610 type:complete len:434 (+) Transcript_7667:76-1377(+)
MGECSLLEDLCLSELDGHPAGVFFEVFLVIYGFLGLATICDEYLVISLEILCIRWGIREDIAGATFMAFGSAAPEIVVNAVTTLKGQSGTGVGAIIGSGWIAFLAIPGACALFTNNPLEIKRRPMLRDMIFYTIALIELSVFFADGSIAPYEATCLVVTYLVFLIVVWVAPIIRRWWRQRQGEIIANTKSFVELVEEEKTFLEVMEIKDSKDSEALNEFVTEAFEGPEGEGCMGLVNTIIEYIAMPLTCLFMVTCPPCKRNSKYECLYPLTFLMSFTWVAIFSFVVSTVVERWAAISGLNSGFFGLFLISVGAEIPDTIQSVTVAKRGYGSMAVANSIGSQIINICLGLGFPWVIHNMAGKPVEIQDHKSLQVAVFFQAGVVFFSFCIFLGSALVLRQKKAILNRTKGCALILAYIAVLSAYAGITFGTEKSS